MPVDLAFDHREILADYFIYRRTGRLPPPRPSGFRGLSEVEQTYLLRLAREEIAALLEGRPTKIEVPPPSALLEPGGAFVSLHRGGELRGCIGSLLRDRPLHEVVRDMASAAAFRDPRFGPLTRSELASLEIEISILSEPLAASPERVIPGLHGISISLHGRKGVFLPRVARDAGWDRLTLLAETCLKAGLPPDAWQDPAAQITLFTAEVFSTEF
ncbi:MAG: AmmeMemoRadiSam system protein A [Deltaproteobacteria bacterium]|nr:AmmeMemoRadiSam system protein A [Deltaproteobacteria bacterium]